MLNSHVMTRYVSNFSRFSRFVFQTLRNLLDWPFIQKDNAGFILSGKHGKVREFKVIWKTHGKVREISKKSTILTFFWKITNFNTNINKNPF
jgi:hypothetical protein